MKHYTDFTSFTEAYVAFVREVRDAGFLVGLQNSLEGYMAVLEGIWLDRDLFEYALASICCNSEEERLRFGLIYHRFWREKGSRVTDHREYKNKKALHKKSPGIAVMLGTESDSEKKAEDDAKTTSGANVQHFIRRTDFTKLTSEESEFLDELAERLLKEMSLRLKRKRKKAKRGQADIARSIRKNIQRGGDLIELSMRNRKPEKFRLLVMLDVSGSMDKYSFYLLKFIWALRSHFSQVEAFVFSTHLERITDHLDSRDLPSMLASVSQSVTNWSSGTRIGESLLTFNEKYAKKYLNGSTMTIILSDGLDTGEPAVLESEIQKIKLRSKRLVWLNPLKGMKGYEPIQRGMKTVLPALHHFGSAHNLDSLLELENILVNA